MGYDVLISELVLVGGFYFLLAEPGYLFPPVYSLYAKLS